MSRGAGRGRDRPSILAGVAVAWALGGCTASVSHRDGRVIEGQIVGGDRETVVVAPPDGEPITLDRAGVVDIDHPGDVAFVVGLHFAVAGLALAFDGAQRADDTGASTFASLGLALLAMAPSVAGGAVYLESRLSARRRDEPQPTVHVTPAGIRVRF